MGVDENMKFNLARMEPREKIVEMAKELIEKCFVTNDDKNSVLFYMEDGRPRVKLIENTHNESLPSSVDKLYEDIDKCITNLVSARINKDVFAEGRALFTMESLMVCAMQELSYIHDQLKVK